MASISVGESGLTILNGACFGQSMTLTELAVRRLLALDVRGANLS